MGSDERPVVIGIDDKAAVPGLSVDIVLDERAATISPCLKRRRTLAIVFLSDRTRSQAGKDVVVIGDDYLRQSSATDRSNAILF